MKFTNFPWIQTFHWKTHKTAKSKWRAQVCGFQWKSQISCETEMFLLGLLTYICQFFMFFSGMSESTGNPWISLKSADFSWFTLGNSRITHGIHKVAHYHHKLFHTKDQPGLTMGNFVVTLKALALTPFLDPVIYRRLFRLKYFYFPNGFINDISLL